MRAFPADATAQATNEGLPDMPTILLLILSNLFMTVA